MAAYPAVSSLDALPLRNRASGLPVPPARMRAWRDGRPLKHWRYVGLYGPELMLCAATVRIGVLPQAFFAVWDGRALRERTIFRPGVVTVRERAVTFPGGALVLEPDGDAMSVVSRHGGSYIWTRKRPVVGHGSVDGRAVRLRGLVDESAGYHARETAWRWSAGVGVGAGGEPLAWNLVDGVHDAERGSERTVWVDGVQREVAPVVFDEGLTAVRAAGGGAELRFAEQARRARSDDFKVFASDYVQPFGTFAGTLPSGVEVAEGWGVMERHEVRW